MNTTRVSTWSTLQGQCFSACQLHKQDRSCVLGYGHGLDILLGDKELNGHVEPADLFVRLMYQML